MKHAFIAAAILLAAPSAQAQGLGELIGQVQTTAKASAFDMVVGSQVPALSGLTGALTPEQKAQLFDLGAENAGMLGSLGTLDSAGSLGALATGAAALGLVPQPPYAPPVPATESQTVTQQEMLDTLIRLGIGALGE